MQVQTFVTTVLTEICNGIKDAQANIDGGIVNPHGLSFRLDQWIVGSNRSRDVQMVEFDMAVTVNEQNDNQIGGGISIIPTISVGGKKSSSTESSATSRIKFSVPVAFPAGGELAPPPKDETDYFIS